MLNPQPSPPPEIHYAEAPGRPLAKTKLESIPCGNDFIWHTYSEGRLLGFETFKHLAQEGSTTPDVERCNHGPIRDFDKFALINMGFSVGLGLFVIGNIKKGEYLLYSGALTPESEVSDFTYAMEYRGDIVIDAKNKGDLSRFMQALPAKSEDPRVATANFELKPIKHKGSLYMALRATCDIDGSLATPVICGYDYGLGYWKNLGIQPFEFYKDGRRCEEPSLPFFEASTSSRESTPTHSHE